jgi:hypothetical protein
MPNFSTPKGAVAVFGAVAVLALPAVASAQQPYGNGPYGQPTYAQPAPQYANQPAIKGTITSFDGQWIVYMHDEKGYTDHITLHQGTIINPTGIRLNEGMQVTVYGYADGPTFQANRIDVAYSPYSPYYGSDGQPYGGGYGYGGYYPYGYGYGYGSPAIGIGVNWGWGWGWGWPGYGYWGWPGAWGGYWGGYPGYYGGYGYRGPYYYPGRGGFVHGTVGAPPRGGAVRGGPGGAPVSGGVHGGGGGRPR